MNNEITTISLVQSGLVNSSLFNQVMDINQAGWDILSKLTLSQSGAFSQVNRAAKALVDGFLKYNEFMRPILYRTIQLNEVFDAKTLIVSPPPFLFCRGDKREYIGHKTLGELADFAKEEAGLDNKLMKLHFSRLVVIKNLLPLIVRGGGIVLGCALASYITYYIGEMIMGGVFNDYYTGVEEMYCDYISIINNDQIIFKTRILPSLVPAYNPENNCCYSQINDCDKEMKLELYKGLLTGALMRMPIKLLYNRIWFVASAFSSYLSCDLLFCAGYFIRNPVGGVKYVCIVLALNMIYLMISIVSRENYIMQDIFSWLILKSMLTGALGLVGYLSFLLKSSEKEAFLKYFLRTFMFSTCLIIVASAFYSSLVQETDEPYFWGCSDRNAGSLCFSYSKNMYMISDYFKGGYSFGRPWK